MAVKLDIRKSVMNPVLSRREVSLVINHHGEGTPSKDLIISELNQIYSTSAANIYVFGVTTGFGSSETVAHAHLYNSIDDMKRIEYPYVVARKTGEVQGKVGRRVRKENRKKAAKIFGTMKRNMAKAAKRAKDD